MNISLSLYIYIYQTHTHIHVYVYISLYIYIYILFGLVAGLGSPHTGAVQEQSWHVNQLTGDACQKKCPANLRFLTGYQSCVLSKCLPITSRIWKSLPLLVTSFGASDRGVRGFVSQTMKKVCRTAQCITYAAARESARPWTYVRHEPRSGKWSANTRCMLQNQLIQDRFYTRQRTWCVLPEWVVPWSQIVLRDAAAPAAFVQFAQQAAIEHMSRLTPQCACSGLRRRVRRGVRTLDVKGGSWQRACGPTHGHGLGWAASLDSCAFVRIVCFRVKAQMEVARFGIHHAIF